MTKDPCRRDPKITVPKPEMTKDKKFKCPLDQTVHDNKEDYEKQIKIADDWIQRNLDTKKIKASRAPGNKGGIVNDSGSK